MPLDNCSTGELSHPFSTLLVLLATSGDSISTIVFKQNQIIVINLAFFY